MPILRVFPRKTKATPEDEYVVRPDRALLIIDLGSITFNLSELTCLTEWRKLKREHSTAGKRLVIQRLKDTTELQQQSDMRFKLPTERET